MKILQIIKNSFNKTFFIIVCLITMIIFASLISSCIESSQKSIMELNNEKSDNHIDFSFDERLNTAEEKKIITELEHQKNIILRHSSGIPFDVNVGSEGLYFNNMFTGGYELLEGRFFNASDFYNTNNKIVIGKSLLNKTIIEHGSRFLYSGNDKYHVIGVVGKKGIPTRYDSTIFYCLNLELKTDSIQNEFWTLDSTSRSESDLKEIINRINSKYNNSIIIGENEETLNPLNTAIKSSSYIIINFTLIILCVFLSRIKAISYWLDSIKLEIGVRKTYGASNFKLSIYIAARYLNISILSSIIALLLQKLLLAFNIINQSSYYMSFANVITAIIFILLLGIIFIMISMAKINKIEANELLKGN